MRKLLIVILGILSISLMVGCSSDTEKASNSDDEIELRLMRAGDSELIHSLLDPLIEKFEEENPNIKIKFEEMGFNEVDEKFSTMSSSNTMPDVFYSTLEALVYSDSMLPLNEYFDKSDDLKGDIYPNVIEMAQYEDDLLMIPNNTSSIMLWYNKELFEEAGLDPDKPPKTTEELVEYSQTIEENTDATGFGVHAEAAGGDFAHQFQSFYQMFSGEEVWDKEKGQYTFMKKENKQALIDTFQWWYDLTEKYDITQGNVSQYGRFDLRPLFNDGKLAMVMDGVWIENEIKDGLESGKFMNALLPEGPGESNKSIQEFGGWSIGANSEHPDEAWKLIEFLMETDNQIVHSEYGSAPILESEVEENPKFEKDYWKVIDESIQESTSQAVSDDIQAYHLAISEVGQQIMLGSVTAEEGATELIERIQEID